MGREPGLDVLVGFARTASEEGGRAAVLPALAEALARHAGAAVAIVDLPERGPPRLVPSPHLPAELAGFEVSPIDASLAGRMLRACGERFARVEQRPLASGGATFGFVFLLLRAPLAQEAALLAEGLVHVAALSLDGAEKRDELARASVELHDSRETLARTEKLRALGQMAAGISHDLKNMLNPLSLHLQLVERAAARGDVADVKESAAEMKQVLARGVQTVERLRAYSRQSDDVPPGKVDLDHLAREAVEIAKPRMSSRAGRLSRIELALGAPPRVIGRAPEIVSAVVNLIVNAIDALPAGGVITVSTAETDEGSAVTVADDGPGMPPDVERRIFEPFFTTKGFEGTGLGLAMVLSTMERHGGAVSLRTAPGKGARFTLSFPRAPSP